jgi:hypothetical protein
MRFHHIYSAALATWLTHGKISPANIPEATFGISAGAPHGVAHHLTDKASGDHDVDSSQ